MSNWRDVMGAPRPKPSNVSGPSEQVEVTILAAEGCHLCEEAQDLVRALAPTAHIHEIDVLSREGREVARRHGTALVPVIVVDGRLVSSGRVRRRQLIQALRGEGDG